MGIIWCCKKKRVRKVYHDQEEMRTETVVNICKYSDDPQSEVSEHIIEDEKTSKQNPINLILKENELALKPKEEEEKTEIITHIDIYNQKALISLPTSETINQMFLNENESFYEEKSDWYPRFSKYFTDFEPIYTKSKISKTNIEVQQSQISNRRLYIGEMNEAGQPHGYGIMIEFLNSIKEAQFKNGLIHGK